MSLYQVKTAKEAKAILRDPDKVRAVYCYVRMGENDGVLITSSKKQVLESLRYWPNDDKVNIVMRGQNMFVG